MERNKDVLYFSHLPCYTVILHVTFIFKNCILSFMSFNENVTSDALELQCPPFIVRNFTLSQQGKKTNTNHRHKIKAFWKSYLCISH